MAMATDTSLITDPMEVFYRDLEAKRLDALWRREGHGSPRPPAPYAPCRWRWADIEPFIARATELVKPGPESQRRALTLVNPDVPSRSATHMLTAAVQTVLPGEISPSHRHTPAAIRFIIRGTGALTVVDGEPAAMNPGDLVLTPSWAYHGHIHQGDGPQSWMDSLDASLVGMLRQSRYEQYPDELEPATKAVDDSYHRYGAGHLRPVWAKTQSPVSPLLSFPWAQTERSLHELAKVDSSPFDDIAFEYTNPTTGSHVLPTIGCWIQMLRPGVHTQAHRHASCQVYHVFRGQGATIIDGVQLDWEQGDFFALPPHCWHEHRNASSSDEAVLFSTTDTPVMDALNLYYEDAYAERGGHQDVVASYAERYESGRARP
jgi:gentisate 1,2-dioxygenase